VVECTALEMRHTRKGIGGSNPSFSAINFTHLFENNVEISLVDFYPHFGGLRPAELTWE
jgi:hypothetical protein